MKVLKPWLAIASLFVLLFACQKEISKEVPGDDPGNGGTGGAGNSGSWGWSFKGDAGNYHGCIDTAFYQTVNGIKALSIEGSDSVDNFISITLVAVSGNFQPGTYTTAQGAILMVQDKNGVSYISDKPTSFTIKISTITDTLIEATFSGSLNDVLNSGTFKVTDGSLKAKIGKVNPCSNSGTGNGGGGGNGNGNADFSLYGTGSSCSNAIIEGKYVKTLALTGSNTVELEVDVQTAGNWSVTTNTINGIKFSGSGTFSGTGFNTIVLTGSGTPLQNGATVIPVTAGASSCSFTIDVDTIPVAPCNPAGNTAELQGVSTMNFTAGAYTTVAGGSYSLTGNSSGGDMHLEFAGTTQPAAGAYNVQPLGGSFLTGDVRVDFTASNIYWQCGSGKVYVTVNNGKVTATFCELPISGTLGGPSFTSKATGSITEK